MHVVLVFVARLTVAGDRNWKIQEYFCVVTILKLFGKLVTPVQRIHACSKNHVKEHTEFLKETSEDCTAYTFL